MKKNVLHAITPAPRDVWNEIIRQDPYALISHTPEWVDCICQTGPYVNTSRLYEFSHGRRVLLPAVRHKSLPESVNSEKSLPHGWGIGGLVAPGGVTPEEIATIFPDTSSWTSRRTSIRPNPLLAPQWRISISPDVRSERHSTHILSLDGGFEQVWSKQFDSATRNKIRKAEKSGVSLEQVATKSSLPDFYQLYLSWSERRGRERHLPASLSRRLAKLREPYSKFETVSNLLGEACRLWVARLGDQLVAAAFLLVWGEHAVYWRSASDKELTLKTRANDLLQKIMIEEACLSGCRYYHMGESGGVASLMHFKSRFGAVEYPYEEYYFGHLPLGGFPDRLKDFYRRGESVLLALNRKKIHETRPDD